MTSTSLCQSRSLPVVPTKIPPWVIRPEHYPPGLEHVPIVQAVQKVQIVQTPSFILPRVAGEERGGGWNGLNSLNELNACLYSLSSSQSNIYGRLCAQ